MNEADKLKQLEEELARLKEELRDNYQKIEAIQHQVALMRGTSVNKVQTQAPHHSLEHFIGLNLIHFIGIIVLVIGLSIGVKYAIDINLISEKSRIGLAYLAGVVLFLLSLRLRKNLAAFSAILFSGSMASIYFTTYAAYAYYHIYSGAFSFLLMILLTVYTVYQALQYDREEIALLGMAGAYGIPFLISKNANHSILFFLYIAVINSGIFFLQYKKQWKLSAWLAMLITWVLFLGWEISGLKPGDGLQAIFFLFLFFIMFLTQSVLPLLKDNFLLPYRNEIMLLFTNLAFSLGAYFSVEAFHQPPDTSLIIVFLSVFMAIEACVFMLVLPAQKMIFKYTCTLSFIFLVIFIGDRWEGVMVTLLWLFLSVLVFLTGVLRKSVFARLLAVFLMGLTLAKLVLLDSLRFTSIQKIICYVSLGILLLFVSFFYQRFREIL